MTHTDDLNAALGDTAFGVRKRMCFKFLFLK